MIGKPLSDPDVVAYLRNGGFRNNMRRAREWMESGRTHVMRYERLHADPSRVVIRPFHLGWHTAAGIARAKVRGCKLVQLTSDNSRQGAHRLYERLGFKASHVGMKLYLD